IAGDRGARAAATAVADEPSPRPHLTLVTPPAPEPAPRQLARSSAERLADATGGEVLGGEGGLRSVSFPAPGQAGLPELSTAPITVSRDFTDAPAQQSQPAAHSDAAQHPADGAHKGVDMDAVYDEFIERFKRDLLIEREQLGHLLI